MDFNKKEMPIQGFAGFGGGATSAAFRSSASGAKYVDEVFYSTPYTGNDGAQSFSTGVNMSKGGLLWVKRSSASENHYLFDSERKSGSNFKSIYSDLNSAEDTRAWGISFDNNGHSFDDNDNAINNDGDEYVNWTFRKKEKFFDVQTYTGNGSNQNISHDLGCVPGFVAVKCTSTGSTYWSTWHRSIPDEYMILSENNAAAAAGATRSVTNSHYQIFGSWPDEGQNGREYVVYLWAGGASAATTATSVDFDGVGDKISIANHSDYVLANSAYTMEFWVYKNADTPDDFDCWAAKGSNNNNTREWAIESMSDQTIDWFYTQNYNGSSWVIKENISGGPIPTNEWVHIALERDVTAGGSSSRMSFYVNGKRTYKGAAGTGGNTGLNDGTDPLCIAGFADANNQFESNVKISNFRLVKGTAIYNAPSFKVPTSPLTSISNTRLLCCQNSTVTGATTDQGTTISSSGDPSVSTATPFDDPDGFGFGEDEDQQIITTGSYLGDGQTVGPEIYLGWEPQWIMLKRADSTGDWGIFDTMRGLPVGGSDYYLRPNLNNDSATAGQTIELTPTGFKLRYGQTISNLDGAEMVYVAIRRPDALVGKPAEAGTDAFAIDLDGTNSGNPSWVSGFPVDMSFIKDRSGTTYDWFLSSRLTQGNYISMMSNAVQASNAVYMYDYINGWGNYSSASSITSWMWKRGKGYTTTVYRGGGTAGQVVNHDLNAVPKMIWVKRITGSVEGWSVYHVGLNGGTNPSHYNLKLDETAVEEDTESRWYDTAPTSTYFQIGDSSRVNGSDDLFMAMLFTDVTGFSKCGYYDGSNSEQTITTGFQPRFVIIKCTTNAEDWYLLDTERGWGSGNDKVLRPNLQNAQYDNDLGAPTSTGFTLTVDNGSNASGRKYVYYAHA